MADFNYSGSLGFAADIDILMKFVKPNPHGIDFGHVHYNSIVDTDHLGVNQGMVFTLDAGLLKIGGPPLCARLNWWNHPTGPNGAGPGFGEPLLWKMGGSVDFVPWLYVEHTQVLEEQIGKFGFFIPMCKGLNTFSTPIALEETVVPSRQWIEILTNSGVSPGDVKFIRQWNAATQDWEDIDMTDAVPDYVDPLYGFYIYLRKGGVNLILMVNSSHSHPFTMPTRQLYGDRTASDPDLTGWNLVGPNPQFMNPGMAAKVALSSVQMTPSGLPGYTQAISPNVWCQPPWIFTPDMPGPGPTMISGRAYWVWMENNDMLVGYGFTPLPAGP
jgi:hypothetical protein